MSNNRNVNWEIEDEDEDDDFIPQGYNDDSKLVRDFRKQLNAEKRKTKEQQALIDSLVKSQRERIIKDVLTSKGVSADIANAVPADIEASDEAISNWVTTMSAAFGVNLAAQTKVETPAVNPQDIAALQRMNDATTGVGTPSFEETLASQINGFEGSADEFMSILSGQ